MSVVTNILRAYRAPARVIAEQIEQGVTEAQTLALAMLAGAINLIAQVPALYRRSLIDDQEFVGLFAAQFIASIFFLPLAIYALSAVFHLVLRAFGGKASWPEARRSFVWPVLVASPFVLITGIVSALSEQFIWGTVSAMVTLLVFTWQWYVSVREVEFG